MQARSMRAAAVSPTPAGYLPLAHDVVEGLAKNDPQGCALRHGAERLSRAELSRRSTVLAQRLLAAGIAPGNAVAVRLDRSFEQIIACLAVLKAGSAFMPLDPADPIDRAAALIDSSGAAVTITDRARAAQHRGRVIAVDDDEASSAPCPLPRVGPGALAYVAHTSGSTGTPNGVEITHANLAHLIAATRDTFALTAADRTSHVLGLGFDAAIFEVWPALAAGATVHIIDDVVRTSPDLLRQALIDQRITVATVPTILAEQLIRADWPRDGALRCLLTGGDVLRVRPRDDLPFVIVNNYGPTECTCQATSGVVAPRGEGLPTIGRPFPGVSVHILDDALRPVGLGIEGDIWIGGAGVGRGYRNRPDLTAAAFRPDPFAAAEAWLYRSGDRGRRLDNGEIAFCGRLDRQTKIGGVRIEPEEVAAVLHRHPGLESATVTAVERDGHKLLAAYVVPAAANREPPTAAELRRFLQRFLPCTHLPGIFVTLDTMPLTANGKIDRAALPAPTLPPAGPERRALSPVETVIAHLASEALRDGTAAIDANFFLSGGDSLGATQLVVACRETFGVTIALHDLFEAETLAEFAATIERRVIDLVESMSDRDVVAAIGQLDAPEAARQSS